MGSWLAALAHADELLEVVDGALVVKRVGGNPHHCLARRLAEELERQWVGAVATAPGQWAVRVDQSGVLVRGRLPDVLVDGDELLTRTGLHGYAHRRRRGVVARQHAQRDE